MALSCVICGVALPSANRVVCSMACSWVNNSRVQQERAANRFTFAQLDALAELYATGLSYAKMAVVLALSESQVERLARKMGLPLRGSAVQKAQAQAQSTSVSSLAADIAGAQPELCADSVSSSTPTFRAPDPQSSARSFPVVPLPVAPFRFCQWIEGDGRPWTRCGAPTFRHSPYCAVHYRRAYARRAEHLSMEAA